MMIEKLDKTKFIYLQTELKMEAIIIALYVWEIFKLMKK